MSSQNELDKRLKRLLDEYGRKNEEGADIHAEAMKCLRMEECLAKFAEIKAVDERRMEILNEIDELRQQYGK